MDKIRTTLYIDRRLMDLVKLEVDNVSNTMETLLTRYVSANSTEQLDKKIEGHQSAIDVLKQKKHDLLQRGIKEDKIQGMTIDIEAELKEVYRKRREQLGDNLLADEQWITSPKNLSKCKILEREPFELLYDLRDWYDKR